jgi:hypothetical protein
VNPGTDPLAALRGLQPPHAVGLWPPAPGWWALLGLAVAAIVAAGFWWRRRRRRTAPLGQARTELDTLATEWRAHGDHRRLAAGVAMVLRRVALVRFPGERVAGLTGEAWLAFLDSVYGDSAFTRGVGRTLERGPYAAHAEYDAPALLALARRWIERAFTAPGVESGR